MDREIRVNVNGEPRRVSSSSTVATLLASMGVQGPCAVERNREIVPRALHAETALAEGDELEVVGFVGGG